MRWATRSSPIFPYNVSPESPGTDTVLSIWIALETIWLPSNVDINHSPIVTMSKPALCSFKQIVNLFAIYVSQWAARGNCSLRPRRSIGPHRNGTPAAALYPTVRWDQVWKDLLSAIRRSYLLGEQWGRADVEYRNSHTSFGSPMPRLKSGAHTQNVDGESSTRRDPPPLRFGAALLCIASHLETWPRRRPCEVGFSPYRRQ